MRRSDKEIKEIARIREIISECKVCRLGLVEKGQVYIVPMNFGAVYESGEITLYFHCAEDGRRMSILEENNKVGFEMDCMHELNGDGEKACTYSYRYASIIGSGIAEVINTTDEKIYALRCLMRHQTGKDFAITETMTNHVAVLRVRVSELSCKECK